MEPRPELNLDWITPHLAVGGRFEAEHCDYLVRALGIHRVVDVRVEACDDEAVLHRHGISLLHLPTVDRCAVAQELLDLGVHWVVRQLDDGHRVFVHCEHGIGRSALLALCVLVKQGHAPLEALKRAKAARWKVSPSPEQLDAFTTWCRRSGVAAAKIPDFEQLAYIAYAHLREPQASSEGGAPRG